jgi:uncharacterized protein (TIGR03790 family)
MRRSIQTLLIALLIGLLAPRTFAAVTQASNVIVLVNSNSTTSVNIGNTYVANHPGSQTLTLSTSTNEVITSSDFQSTILTPVQSYLETNNKVESTHYIITTKGMPLKVSGTGEFTTNCNGGSIDSELAVAEYLVRTNGTPNAPDAINNPYAKVQTVPDNVNDYHYNYFPKQTFADYKAAQTAGSAEKALYLTSRLDAYSEADVMSMMNRAKAPAPASPFGKTFVLDDNSTKDYDRMAIGPHNSVGASEEIAAHGGIVQYDNTAAHLSESSNPTPSDVMGYVGHGGNDGQPTNYISNLGYTLANGAMFSSYESYNANSFIPGGNALGQGLVADWIQAGGTAATGTVYEPFAEAIAHEEIFFPALMEGYTFADAMWMSTEYMSWQNVMVGDPLMIWSVPEPASVAFIVCAGTCLIRRPRRRRACVG